MNCIVNIFLVCLIINNISSEFIIWDNSIDDYDLNDIGPFNAKEGRKAELRLPNWIFIFPGTKWCGAGNISDGLDDYGIHRDTDKCCRNHDLCPDLIEGYDSKYNLTNPSFYTRLNCDCDEEFYKCLKSVNSFVSKQVGHGYFTLLNTKCYRNDYPISSCEKYTYFPTKKCVKYTYDTTGEKVYQWFDEPNF